MLLSQALRVLVPVGIGALLAYRGVRKGSLSRSGGQAAFTVGAVSLGCLPRSGVALLVFYWTGSKLTRTGADVKATIDSEYRVGGERSAEQVLSCSLLGTLLAAAHLLWVGADGPVFTSAASLAHRAIVFGTAAHYATAAADTWASELGVLSKSWPVLVTDPTRRVPPGTNGGISSVGTLASLGGGAVIGLSLWMAGWCSTDSQGDLARDWQLVPLSALFGVLGSVVDSLFGVWFQETLYDTKQNRIVSEHGENVKVICGKPILNNQQVNQASLLVMTLAGCAFALLI